jgi:small-conductance mechanosensitive channel
MPKTAWQLMWVVLLTLALWVSLLGIRHLKQKARHWCEHRSKDRPLYVHNWELLSAEKTESTLMQGLHALTLLLQALLILVYLALLLGIFDLTREISRFLFTLFGQLMTNIWSGFVSWLPNLLLITLLIIGGYVFLKGLKALSLALERGQLHFQGFYPEWAMTTYHLVKVLWVLFLLALAYPLLPGAETQAFKGISIFFGVLLSLGSSSAVANMIAGIVLVYTRAFDEGDRIETNGVLGDVVERSMLVTRLRTIKNVAVTLPNSMVLGTHTRNYSREAREGPGLILPITLSLGYEVPYPQVHALLIEAALETPGTLKDPMPFIYHARLSHFSVSYELNVYTRNPQQMAEISSELNRNIQRVFAREGIDIFSPVMVNTQTHQTHQTRQPE